MTWQILTRHQKGKKENKKFTSQALKWRRL
jgi:hypothetical protein